MSTNQATTESEQVAVERTTQVQEVRIRMAGEVFHRVDVTRHGGDHAVCHVMLGGTLLHIRHGKTAREIAEIWAGARMYTHRLPAQAPQQFLGETQGTGPVSVALTLGSQVGVTGELTMNERTRRPEIELRVGPITWCVVDQHAYATGLRIWPHVAELLRS